MDLRIGRRVTDRGRISEPINILEAREPTAGGERYLDRARRALKSGAANALCTTDVAGYFATIQLALMERRLRTCDCEAEAVEDILRLLESPSVCRRWTESNL